MTLHLRDRMDTNDTSRIGFFSDGEYEVYVQTDNNRGPSFRIRDTETLGNYFHTCLKIKIPSYSWNFPELNFMTNKMKKDLVEFLNSKPPQKKYVSFSTFWEKLIYEWNENNPNNLVDEEQPMPDYRKL